MDMPTALAAGHVDGPRPVRLERTDAGLVVTVAEGTPWSPALARTLGDLLALPRLDELAG